MTLKNGMILSSLDLHFKTETILSNKNISKWLLRKQGALIYENYINTNINKYESNSGAKGLNP